MGSSLNWLQFWWAAKCILYSFKKKTRKKKKKIWRNKWRYCMTSKRSNTWSKTFEQEQHKLILRTDGRFNLLWCDTVFDFFSLSLFFFSSIVCFSSRTVKSERNGNSYGDINIICIVKFFKQNWVYRSLWTMKKQTTISFALVFLCVAGKCRSSAQIHGWNHPSLFHTEISIVWDILINMSKWLLFYIQFYMILD